MQKKHFYTFDFLRLIAFLLVFFSHLPIEKSSFLYFFSKSGGIGVEIFFVLSGFLITYILLIEKNRKTFKLGHFFMRRILRIWPLYYLMLLFAFLTPYILDFLKLPSSNEGYYPNWIYPLTFTENYQMMLNKSFANVSPLRVMWSLCIEEQFYILWGILFLIINPKHFNKFLITSIILAIILRYIYNERNIYTIDLPTNIDFFSWGGLVAYLFIYNSKIINKLSVITTIQKAFIGLLIILIYLSIPHFNLNSNLTALIIGAFTSFLIGLTLTYKNPLKISDKNIFSKLGKYTYGMYLFHTIIIILFFKLLDKTFSPNLIIFISLVSTIIMSYLSYNLFEMQFLKLKKYFK